MIGVAMLLVALVIWLIYLAVHGSAKSSSAPTGTSTTSSITPAGSSQVIKENAPIDNQGVSGSSNGGNASQYNVVPVGSNASGSGTNGSGGGSGSTNGCPDYLGDNQTCVPSNYTLHGMK